MSQTTKLRAKSSKKPGEPDSKSRLRLWLRVLKISRSIEGELREKLRTEFDTTLPRFDVMAALFRAEYGLNMSGLSSVLRVSNGNVTGIVDRLVVDGYVIRIPVEGDRRAMIVRLTVKGREHFQQLAAVHEAWVSELLAATSGEEAEELASMLAAVGRGIEGRKARRA